MMDKNLHSVSTMGIHEKTFKFIYKLAQFIFYFLMNNYSKEKNVLYFFPVLYI